MTKFNLVRWGSFKEEGKSLKGLEAVVMIYYGYSKKMEAQLLKAYHRLMYHFTEYDVFHTEIYTPEHEELLVFCKKDCSTEVIQAIQEHSKLEKVPKAKKGDTSLNGVPRNFWWCIDIQETYGDWIAFLQPKSNLFINAVKNDYQNWLMSKTPEEREEEYKESLR